MAFTRSISIRRDLLARRFNPSLSYLSHGNDRSNQEDLHQPKSTIERFVDQRRSSGSFVDDNSGQLSGALHRTASVFAGSGLGLNSYMSKSMIERYVDQRSSFGSLVDANSRKLTGAFHRTGSVFAGSGLGQNRYMSTSIGKDNMVNYAADVTTNVPSVSEVAIAAADSMYPVAALQHFIDGIHSLTGLNWWACIALTTLIYRVATVPLDIYVLKAKSKLKLMKLRVEEIERQMKETEMEPQAVAEGQKKIKQLLEEHVVPRYTELMAAIIKTPLLMSAIVAIMNKVKKVPSFKDGGALWFTDLTVADAMYISPVLAALTVIASMELNLQAGLKEQLHEGHPLGHPAIGILKKYTRGLMGLIGVTVVPLTMYFPQVFFCCLVPSNLFSICYDSVLRVPEVKVALGITERPSSTTLNSSSGISFTLIDHTINLEEKEEPSSIRQKTRSEEDKNTQSDSLSIGLTQNINTSISRRSVYKSVPKRR